MSRNDTTSTRPAEVVIQSTRPAVLEAVSDFAALLEKRWETDEKSLRSLIDALAALTTTPAHEEQLRANAELRARFMREVPWLRSADIARLYGLASPEPMSWKAAQRIFSVTAGDVEQFPLFQFDEGQPVGAMHDILALFTGLTDWQIALWFYAPNAWLGGAPPMDLLQVDPGAVIAAAGRAIEPIEG